MKQLFRLNPEFVARYATITPPFEFNGLGELVYLRTYSRLKEDGTQERWHETVERVVNGTYTMQKNWIVEHNLGWSERKAQRSAQEMYERMFYMKFLPPGRGLWAMGSPLTEERGLFAALNNCAFVSTNNLAKDKSDPFTFLMDASMLGIGVGFDTKGAGQLSVWSPSLLHKETFVIPDTREGWVQALRVLLDSHFERGKGLIAFDYSLVRPEGQPIKGFGGISSGPAPLEWMLEAVRGVLKETASKADSTLSVTGIVDIMNIIGKCVVAGNVRRTAEIAFGDANSDEFLNLKNYDRNPQREDYGWTSNNSVFAELGMDYTKAATQVATNGEPGFAWLGNMQAYSRMNNGPDYADKRALGGNPCLEQTLESYELCCLVETFPANHDSLEDYQRTLKFAYLYAKTVTLGKTPWARTNRVMLRNRRIGLSQSGIQQAVTKLGLEEYRKWCVEGYLTVRSYDEIYSEWLTIPKSVKVTSVKPSGSVSLLAGATPGMHWPEDRIYIRRMRISKWSDLLQPLIDAGYSIEPAVGSEDSTVVVSIPVRVDEPVRTVKEVSMWEQLAMAAFLQRYWADNQVSCTVTFNPVTEGPQIADALNYYQYQLKGISFLPAVAKGAYAQMPYEGISNDVYESMVSVLKPVRFAKTTEAAEQERFCNNDTCTI